MMIISRRTIQMMREGSMLLLSRCEVDRRRGQSLFTVMKLIRLSNMVSIDTSRQ